MKVGIKMDKKVPLREKLGYGVGAVGLDLSYGLFYSYLSLYLTMRSVSARFFCSFLRRSRDCGTVSMTL